MKKIVASFFLFLLVSTLGSGTAWASFVLSGRVVTESGTPVEGATVEVTKSREGYQQGLRTLDGELEPERLAAGVTDRDGWYWVEVPRPGVWRVAVDASGYVPMERRPEVYVDDERLATVTLARDAGLTVTVTVDGEPLEGARVWAASTLSSDGVWADSNLRQWRPSWLGRRTDARGRATVARKEGERLRVVAWKPGFLLTEHADAVQPVLLEMEAASDRRIVQVVDSRGKPVEDALVLMGETPSWSAGITGEDGTWELPLPGLDDLTLRANAGDGRWVSETFEELPDEGPLVLTLREPTVLTGRVTDAKTGVSLGGALVFRDRSGRFAETGADGRYVLTFSEPLDREAVQAVAEDHRLSGSRLLMPPPPEVDFALEPVFTVRGRVTDSTGTPIEGAQLRVLNNPYLLALGLGSSWGSDGASTTDPDGRFLIVQVPDISDLYLVARAEGYAPVVERISVPREDIEVVLGPGAVLLGRVVDGNEEPVLGARVRAFPEFEVRGQMPPPRRRVGDAAETDYHAATDDEGRFWIPLLPSGDFTLQVDAEASASRLLPGVEIPEAETTVDLGDILLEAGATLEGWVTDDQGRPVSGARVSVVESDRFGMTLFTMGGGPGPDDASSERLTEDDGRFRFDDLQSDTVYSVGAQKEGRVPDQKMVEIPTEKALELVLGTGGRLFGRVTAPTGEPLTRGMVRVEREEEGFGPIPVHQRPERLAADGTFSLEALPPRPLHVRVVGDTGHTSRHGPFEVTAGAETGPLELVHEEQVVLEGRVVGSDGRPAAGVLLGLEAANGRGTGTGTDAGGRFRMAGFEPGSYTLRVRDSELGRASRELELHRGTQQVELVLEPGLSVAGRVVDHRGEPVRQGLARMFSVPPEPSQQTMRVFLGGGAPLEGDGTFRVFVDEPGDYGLWVEAPGYMPWTSPESEPIRVGDNLVVGVVVRLDRGGRIVGRVLGLEEDELAGVRIFAHGDDPAQSRTGSVDHRGRYEIPSVGPGEWILLAATDQPPRQVSETVVVGAEESEVRLDLTFPENELTLRGRVLLDGEPVAGVMVMVLLQPADESSAPVVAQTDSFGRFRLAGLVPGRYEIRAERRPFGRSLTAENQREIEVLTDLEIVLDLQRVEPETQ